MALLAQGRSLQSKARREPRQYGTSRGVPVSAPQLQVRVRAAEDRLSPAVSRQDLTAAGQARVRLAGWRRLCPSSFVLAGMTVLVAWVAVTVLLRRGQLGTVL